VSGNEAQSLISESARWIWDDSNRLSDHYYLRAKRTFRVSASQALAAQPPGASSFAITAEAYYQVWLNGTLLGHGPAKSATDERAVDVYDIGQWLVAGQNVLEVLVLSVGAGTMNYCRGEAGLLFELRYADMTIPSDARTRVQRDPRRLRKTVRRWMMPDIEDVSEHEVKAEWSAATLVSKDCKLIPRPVRLPSRTPALPCRVVARDVVQYPEFICSFHAKPYLVEPAQVERCNLFTTPAYIVTDLVSAKDQTITWLPAPGGVKWYFENKLIGTASGWHREEPGTPKLSLHLKKGANRLVGVHINDHFSEIHLAAFASAPIEVRNPFGSGGFQVILTDEAAVEKSGQKLAGDFEKKVSAGGFIPMDPEDTRPNANFHDLVCNAVVSEEKDGSAPGLDRGWRLSRARTGTASRLILDLGAVQNGWLAFKCFGTKGSQLILSLVEAIDHGPPVALNWPGPCNNSLRYELREGWQEFESFFAYGGRYVVIHHSGGKPVDLTSIEILSANCGKLPQGAFLSDHAMINAIYALCEQTLISSTDDTLTDCPTYEAVNWNFDNRLGTMADLVTMRNIPLLRNTIEQYTRDPQYPGLVRSHTPSAWDNRIPAFCFHWILLCQEFFQHTGDKQFLNAVFPQVAAGLSEGLAMIDANGLLLWPQEEHPWHIIDWHPDRDDEERPFISAEQALFIGALEAGARMTTRSAHVRQWNEAANKLRVVAHKRFWVPERDAYADSIHADGSLSMVSSQASNAVLGIYGVGTSAWRSRLLQRLQDTECDLLPFGSPMGLFYILEFFDANHQVDAIFEMILRKWSQMVEAGDKTAWEHFPEHENKRFPTRSRCHPFSTYILKYYQKYLLGIEPIGLGMSQIRFQPNPPRMIGKVQGVLPTSRGPVRVSWKRKGSKLHSTITTPEGVRQIL